MTRRPLFSTYSQGENRVTGSMIAVFERLDLVTLTSILAEVTDDRDLELVSFRLQPASATGTVPDAEISAGFRYLFETKVAYDSVGEIQVRGHLERLSGSQNIDEHLFVVSPDALEPSAVSVVRAEGKPVTWFPFSALHAAIDTTLGGEGIRDDERLLLRELQLLLEEGGLLGRQDTVIVAAGLAYGFYLSHKAYVCQQGRAFRDELTHLGFYRRGRIERHVPQILGVQDGVVFTKVEASRRRALGTTIETKIADVIDASLTSGEVSEGVGTKVFILTAPDEEGTIELPEPIPHVTTGRGTAFTMGQRYVYLGDLKTAESTTDLR